METDPRGSVLCNITRVETNGLGSSQHPECKPPTLPSPRLKRDMIPPGAAATPLACWKRKSDTRNEIQIHLGIGSVGVHPVCLWPKSERELQGVGLPQTPHSWDLQRDPRQPPAPGAGSGTGRAQPRGTGSGEWLWQIHTCFPFFIHINHRNPLHKAQFQLPYLPLWSSKTPPRATQTWAAHSEIQYHREQLFFSSCFAFCFFLLFPLRTTLGLHPTCRSVS